MPQLEKDSSVAAFFEASEVLVKPMEAFFEKVFVMAEDEKARGPAAPRPVSVGFMRRRRRLPLLAYAASR